MQQGIAHLQELLSESTSRVRIKNNHIPLYSLVCQLLDTLRQFVQSDFKGTWIDWVVGGKTSNSLALLICKCLDISESWVLHCKNSLECQLLAGMSITSDRRKFQLFLRIRKYITQLMSCEKLDNLMMRHEDTFSIFLLKQL